MINQLCMTNNKQIAGAGLIVPEIYLTIPCSAPLSTISWTRSALQKPHRPRLRASFSRCSATCAEAVRWSPSKCSGSTFIECRGSYLHTSEKLWTWNIYQMFQEIQVMFCAWNIAILHDFLHWFSPICYCLIAFKLYIFFSATKSWSPPSTRCWPGRTNAVWPMDSALPTCSSCSSVKAATRFRSMRRFVSDCTLIWSEDIYWSNDIDWIYLPGVP